MKIDMNKEQLKKFLLHAPQGRIIRYIEDVHPVKILEILREENEEDRKDVLSRLPEKFIAEIIDEAETEEKYDILMSFSENRQKNIIEEMSSDELTDLLGMLDKEQADRIIEKMTDEDARTVRQLLSYAPDTAAGIMATEFVAIKEDMTVEQTLKYLQQCGEDMENIYDIYVVDMLDRFKGRVELKDLVTSKFNTILANIRHTNIEVIPYDMDQEEVAHIFEKYGCLTLPVVDAGQRILGIVTFDDAMDVLRDENTEDIHRLGGVNEGEKLNGPLIESIKSRIPWLLVNLITATLAASVVGIFEGTIEKVVALATFMPIVTGMGGNAGTQTLTIIVRGLALGELNFKNVKKIFFKELGVGCTAGIVIGSLVGILGGLWVGKPIFGVIIGSAMILNMMVATSAGYFVPLALKKLKVDPALASSVFVTTFTDMCGFFFFLGLATVFVEYLI